MTEMTWWNALVSWATPDPLDEDAVDLVLEHVEGHHAVISRHPVDGTWEVRCSLQAPGLDAAVTASLDLVVGATGETPIAVEVLREDVFVQRLPHIQAAVKPQP